MEPTNSKRIVALVGRARSGKDTVASALVANGGYVLTRMAAPVKAAASALFGIEPGVLESAAKDDACPGRLSPRTPRHALVWLTAATKEWLGDDAFFSRRLLDAAAASSEHIVIPDVRYAADVAEVRARGGFVIKICRPSMPVRLAWEADIDDLPADAVIVNDGTIDDLVTKAFQAVLLEP